MYDIWSKWGYPEEKTFFDIPRLVPKLLIICLDLHENKNEYQPHEGKSCVSGIWVSKWHLSVCLILEEALHLRIS